MHSRTVKFDFPLQRIQEPLVSTLVKKFDVAPNILAANIDPNRGGWLVVELIGEADSIKEAVDWAASQGVSVSDHISLKA